MSVNLWYNISTWFFNKKCCDNRYYETIDGTTADITDEIPFDLPDGWAWVRQASIITLISGQDFSPDGYNDSQRGIPYITGASNMVDGKVIINRWTENPSSIAIVGDVLITCKGAGVGKMAYMDIAKAHVARQVMAIRPHCNIPSKFIETVLQGQFTKIREQMNGLIPGISRDVMLNLFFPLPPLAEQQRIVEQIETLLKYVDMIDADAETLENSITLAKQKILDLAIRGKLVPQDPTDEPASELLKKIKAEKDALVKAGKLKKDKHESYIFKSDDNCYYEQLNGKTVDISEEIPFDLPESWCWCRLASLCDYGVCQSSSPEEISSEAWVLDLEDIEKDTGKLLQRVFKKQRITSSNKHIFNKGNVLYSKLRTYLNKVLVADMDGFCTSEIFPLDFGENVLSDYARHVLMSKMFLDYTAQCGYGVKMPRLGTNDGRRALFPLPSFAEQQRIEQTIIQYEIIWRLIQE